MQEWNRVQESSCHEKQEIKESKNSHQIQCKMAMKKIQRVLLKLKKTESPEEFINELIQKATDESRLASMYEGWMAWI